MVELVRRRHPTGMLVGMSCSMRCLWEESWDVMYAVMNSFDESAS